MSQSDLDVLRQRVLAHLNFIYPGSNNELLGEQLLNAMQLTSRCEPPAPHENLWSEKDVLLITYGDSLLRKDKKPLETLKRFLHERLHDSISAVHILPFFPWSSDDGFAVINYAEVNDALGEWADVESIAGEFDLMSDLVINHCSSRSLWFENFKAGKDPGQDYFRLSSPDLDLSQVVRPRTSPLLKEVETINGTRYVWCTFSHDQVDLDFANPNVLLEFAGIVRKYLDHGVRIFRLDAVAFLWKELGTPCINLPQTHEMIRLLRLLIEHAAPGAIIITETNIPNLENLSYFGNANEAHSIYNFSLPPLLVNTLVTGNSHALRSWLMTMPPTQQGTCYLNFIASHDGIGLRPVEGLLSEYDVNQLVRTLEGFGAKVSWRTLATGQMRPYEINVALFDAMRGTQAGEDEFQVERFLCAHSIMLAMEGIPALYIHSFLGTENDYRRVELSQHNRAINRHQWDADLLEAQLDDETSHHARVLNSLKVLIALRRKQRAFHPNASQYSLQLGDEIVALWRQSIDRSQHIFAINNITNRPQQVSLASVNLPNATHWTDLIGGEVYTDRCATICLAPYQSIWLSNQ
ncbi:sugar phosphorylase [Marinobacterium sp. YM272]|uniref:sugar phosphorylase n=1 Tax=Marinobacterium sp. YM272 TaxID=3421654 RepID=UPI003D7FF2A9